MHVLPATPACAAPHTARLLQGGKQPAFQCPALPAPALANRQPNGMLASVQGYPLGVVPPLADPPAKKPAAEVDVPGEVQTGRWAGELA